MMQFNHIDDAFATNTGVLTMYRTRQMRARSRDYRLWICGQDLAWSSPTKLGAGGLEPGGQAERGVSGQDTKHLAHCGNWVTLRVESVGRKFIVAATLDGEDATLLQQPAGQCVLVRRLGVDTRANHSRRQPDGPIQHCGDCSLLESFRDWINKHFIKLLAPALFICA
jgi:hypothetical protein